METSDCVLTIYRLRDVSEITGLSDSLDQLRSQTEVRLAKEHVPAVAGELVGIATEILLSPSVQALTTAAELGALLWGSIKCVKVAGKYLRIGKGLVRFLLAAKAREELETEGEAGAAGLADGVVWGPMETEPLSGFALECGFDRDGQSPTAYFMAIAVSRPKQRVRTIYYLLGADGEVCASWSTQTLRDRVPEFLRPPELREGT